MGYTIYNQYWIAEPHMRTKCSSFTGDILFLPDMKHYAANFTAKLVYRPDHRVSLLQPPGRKPLHHAPAQFTFFFFFRGAFTKHFKSDPQPFFWTFWGMFLSHCTAVPQQKIESTVLQNTNQHISTAAAFIYIFFFSCFFGVQPPCVPQQISQAMFLRRNLRL